MPEKNPAKVRKNSKIASNLGLEVLNIWLKTIFIKYSKIATKEYITSTSTNQYFVSLHPTGCRRNLCIQKLCAVFLQCKAQVYLQQLTKTICNIAQQTVFKAHEHRRLAAIKTN